MLTGNASREPTVTEFEDLLRKHMERVKAFFASQPNYEVIRPRLENLVAGEPLRYAGNTLLRESKQAIAEGRHSYDGRSFPKLYLAVSVLPTMEFTRVGHYLTEGYLGFLNRLLRESGFGQGGIDLAHWIYTVDGPKQMAHLTFLSDKRLPREKNHMLIAQDLLTAGEKAQMGMA